MFSNIEAVIPQEFYNITMLLSIIFDIVLSVVAYIFVSLGIKALAKNKGLDKLWLAWIPFFQYILLGKVVGTCFLFRKKVNNLGILVTISSLLTWVLLFLCNLGFYVGTISDAVGILITYDIPFVTQWMAGEGVLFVIAMYTYYAISFVNTVLLVTLAFFVFRKYAPENAFIFVLISVFTDFLLFGVFLFIIRNKKPSNFEEFLRARANSGYNTYQNSYNQYQKKPDSDPFPEFSNKENKEETKVGNKEDNNGATNNPNDDFFN